MMNGKGSDGRHDVDPGNLAYAGTCTQELPNVANAQLLQVIPDDLLFEIRERRLDQGNPWHSVDLDLQCFAECNGQGSSGCADEV